MKKAAYYISLFSLLMVSSGLMMLTCLSVKMLFEIMDKGGADASMFVSVFAAMSLFSCMIYTIFCAFRIYATHNE